MLNSELLTQYALKFLGYGDWNRKVWFIGIEEGGGNSMQDVAKRLNKWNERGRRELENIYEFSKGLEIQQWYSKAALLQRTWTGLFRLLLLARGEEDSDKSLMSYQQNQMDKLCFVELLALPSPNTGTWKYKGWTDVDWLKSRSAYLNHAVQNRANILRDKVLEYKPKVVFFYGTTIPECYLFQYWETIGGRPFDQGIPGEKLFLWTQNYDTLFVITPHPSGSSKEVLVRIGKELCCKHRERFGF